jgi:two-component system chemotaxis response regulator CheY
MCRILERILTQAGFQVRTAQDGVQGLAELAAGPCPDVVMVDWNMPNMNGLEFVRQLRSNPAYSEIRCLMVTTETEMKRVSDALEAGADEYIMKPFTAEVVTEKLSLLGIEA